LTQGTPTSITAFYKGNWSEQLRCGFGKTHVGVCAWKDINGEIVASDPYSFWKTSVCVVVVVVVVVVVCQN
jgi:hypothetical protein